MTTSTTRYLSDRERRKRFLREGYTVILCPLCWDSYFRNGSCDQCSGRGELLVWDVPTGEYL